MGIVLFNVRFSDIIYANVNITSACQECHDGATAEARMLNREVKTLEADHTHR